MGKIRDALDRRQAIRDGVWQTLEYAKKAGGKKKKKKDDPNCKNSQECNVGGKRYCIPKGKTCGGKVRARLDPRKVDDLKKSGGTFEGAIGGLKNGKKYQVSPEMLEVANKLGVSQLQLQSGRVPTSVQTELRRRFNQMTIGDSVTKPKPEPKPEPKPKPKPASATTAKEAPPTLKPKPFNPHGNPKITVAEFAEFWKEKKRLDTGNMSEAEATEFRRKNKQIIDAINHPLLTDDEAKGFKPRMTQEEANAYTQGSVTGDLKFYHGNTAQVVSSMESKGIQPDLNTRGLFGRGAYFGASREIGIQYQSTAQAALQQPTGLVEVQAKVKNPVALDSIEVSKLSDALRVPGSSRSAWDSDTAIGIQSMFRAQGYDSIYLKDKGYFVTFDSRQTVMTNVSHVKTSDEEDQLFKESARLQGMMNNTTNNKERDAVLFKDAPTGQALSSLTATNLL